MAADSDSLLIPAFFILMATAIVLALAFANPIVLASPFIAIIVAARFLKGVGSK